MRLIVVLSDDGRTVVRQPSRISLKLETQISKLPGHREKKGVTVCDL